MELPFKYLGMTIGGNLMRAEFWNPVVSKIRYRLSRWKDRLLSVAGRICLIKSVITSLPLFYLSFFRALVVVPNQIRKIQAKFLSGWGYESRKIAWMKWQKICSPIAVGGLSIKEIGYFNEALITKWKWRLVMSEEGLWRNILEARYETWRSLDVTLVYRKQSQWWKGLCWISNKGL